MYCSVDMLTNSNQMKGFSLSGDKSTSKPSDFQTKCYKINVNAYVLLVLLT